MDSDARFGSSFPPGLGAKRTAGRRRPFVRGKPGPNGRGMRVCGAVPLEPSPPQLSVCVCVFVRVFLRVPSKLVSLWFPFKTNQKIVLPKRTRKCALVRLPHSRPHAHIELGMLQQRARLAYPKFSTGSVLV